jgi:hypothetical protein
MLADALVVGADRDLLGVLLFAKDSGSNQAVIDSLTDLIAEANRSSPSFAQISSDMCRLVEGDRSLPKSSKGTVQRGVAYDSFKQDIEALYASGGGGAQGGARQRSFEEVKQEVREIVLDVTKGRIAPEKLNSDTDLFSMGVDSLMATRIRGGLIKVSRSADCCEGVATLTPTGTGRIV